MGDRVINIILFGAHPDDCELTAGGTCALWVKAGYRVKLVAMTNGDAGHQEMQPGPLAERRLAEAKLSAERGGVECAVLDHHDGHLQPTLEVRREVVRLIREFDADVVISHRPNDYHPDHRYTAQVIQDAAYMVTVPLFLPEVPALRHNPVFMYFMDRFEKPYPFTPDVGVAVDDMMLVKWRMLDAMESQVYEWLPWHEGVLESVPSDPDKRMKLLQKFWSPIFKRATKMGRPALNRWYGKGEAAKITFAELFEVSEYGQQPDEQLLRKIFPFLPKKSAKKKKKSNGKK